MPRGLGEDPLSRKRKGSRRAIHPGETVPGRALATPLSDSPLGVTAGPAASRSLSHNDVFFVKRSATGTFPGPYDDAPAIAEPVSPPPEAAVQSVSAPAVPEIAARETHANEIPAAEPVADAVPETPAQGTPAEAAPIEPAPKQQEAAAPEPAHAETASANPAQEGGLLKRLFGRFHRQ